MLASADMTKCRSRFLRTAMPVVVATLAALSPRVLAAQARQEGSPSETYSFTSDLTLRVHKDTLVLIRRLPNLSTKTPLDTTVYLFVGDSVKRLHPSPSQDFPPKLAVALRQLISVAQRDAEINKLIEGRHD
jgi:hypothetical protein